MKDNLDLYQTNNAPVFASPVTLTGSYVAVTVQSCVLEYLAFANTHTSDIAVSMQDGNGKTFLPGINVIAGTTETVNIPSGGLYFPKGFTLKAGTAAKVDAWYRFRMV